MSKVKQKIEELTPQPMFADRENIKEAFDYATDVMKKSTSPEMEKVLKNPAEDNWKEVKTKTKLKAVPKKTTAKKKPVKKRTATKK